MRRLTAWIFTLSIVCSVPLLAAQNASAPQPNQSLSLGKLARKLRAERKTEGKKPVAVFTNDNLPKSGSMNTVEVSNGAASTSAQSASSAENSTGKHGQEYFSNKAQKIRNDLNMHQRELAVLQQKLSQSQMNYYSSPQKTLEQESGPQFQSDVDKLKKEIAAKQEQIASDQKAMEDLRDELRRDGGKPGWIRE